MGNARLFGTDGIRGRAGEGWLAADRVAVLGRAAGEVLVAEHRVRERADGPPRALVAHDGRRSGTELEAAFARGLGAAGFEVTSAGLLTTPGLALVCRLRGFDLATMISASHNPAEDNGIKIFGGSGDKLADAEEDAIEARVRARGEPVVDGRGPTYDPELARAYADYLVASAAGLELAGRTLVVDCANGGGSRVAPAVFERLGARVHPIACEPDGDNINRGCGATHPRTLQEAVRRLGADLGVALDGDGDRCILADEHGAEVSGDGILTAVAYAAVHHDGLAGDRIVATVMSNRGLHKALRAIGVSVTTVDVGDRRVVEALRREGLALGGEQSGHVVFGGDNHYIGDGIYTALRVLRAMQDEGAPLSELVAPYTEFPQVLVNVPVARKPPLDELGDVRAAVRAVEDELGEDGRVLLRYSGTEPLARVMVEGPDEARIRAQAEHVAELIAREIGGAGQAG